jgi:hypothetical protein
MALTDSSNGMYMPVAPAYAGGNSGFGGWGGDGWWVILFLFALMGNGWGNGFGGGYGNMMLGYDFPWLLNGQSGINTNTNNGFQNAMLNDGITSIRDGLSDISTQLCGGFAGVTASVNGAQNAIAQQLYTNQIADMERSFNAQTASTQGMSALQAQLAQCCCDNRAATADVKYTIANEACATRQNSTANTQAILDKLCQLELDGYKRENDNLRSQLNMATLRESQTAQNAFIQQGFSDEVDQLYNRLSNCPVPSTPIYGRTPIFTCNNNGCACGAM